MGTIHAFLSIKPRSSRGLLWRLRVGVQASLDCKQRLQQLFFPEGIAYDGIRFNRTAVTAQLFNYLAADQGAEESVVSLTFTSWNQTGELLSRVEALRKAA